MKTRLLTLLMLSLMLLLPAACAAPTVAPPPPTATPEPPPAPEPTAIVQALADALNAGDVDAAVAMFADEAVFQMDFYEETLIGTEQIRALFEMLVAGNFRIEVTPQDIDGGTVTTDTRTWGDGVPGDGPNVATEVYVVEEGKITSVTWTPTEETIANIMAAMEEAEAEAEPAQNTFTITFDGDQCIYDGPGALPAFTRIKTVLDMTDQDTYEAYGIALVTLDEGKTIADLEAWPTSDQPLWVHVHQIIDEVPAGTRVEENALLSAEPAYVMCFTCCDAENNVAKTDVLGPIEVIATMDVESIVQALADALNASDVDVAMVLFADEAVFQMDFYEETLIGTEQIRALFEMLVAGNFRIEVTPQDIDGGTVTTDTRTWGDGVPGDGPNVATEVYVIEDGKITSITWTPTEETIANIMAAMEEAEAEPELVKATVNEVEDIVGIWEGDDMGALQFHADGTMLISESLAGLADQASHGKVRFKGSLLIFADADGSGDGSYRVELQTTVEGNPVSLKFHAVKDPFIDRRDVLTERVWHWAEAQVVDETQVTEPMFTITFNGSKCAYDGPEQLPAGQPVIMRLDVEDQTKSLLYGATVITLKEGIGLSDLENLGAVRDSPYGEDIYGDIEAVPAGTTSESTIEIDDGPVYIECFTKTSVDGGIVKRVDALGPIAVVEAE